MSGLSGKFPRHRAASLCLCAVLALTFAGASAPAAMAAPSLSGGGALNELTEGAQSTPTQTTATTGTQATTNSKSVIIIAIVAAFALLIGIAFVIVRDARKGAPATQSQMSEGGSVRDSAARFERRRAKAKAARRQRKRNRQRQ